MRPQASEVWDLGALGQQWTLDSLTQGRTVSSNILARISVHEGSTVAVGLSGRKQVNSLTDLQEAILPDTPRPTNSVVSALHSLVGELAAEGGAVILLVEDDLREPDDPAVRRADPASTLVTDHTVCHVKTLDELTQPSDTSAFLNASASGYPLNCFVFRSMPRDQFNNIVESQRYDELVSHLVLIINTVFDCDSFAVWTPAKRRA